MFYFGYSPVISKTNCFFPPIKNVAPRVKKNIYRTNFEEICRHFYLFRNSWGRDIIGDLLMVDHDRICSVKGKWFYYGS